MNLVVGIDFDNTLVSYDDIIYRTAVQQGLIMADVRKNKREIRDSIRQLPGGEIAWQRLQAIIYGSRMGQAKLIDGVEMFLGFCKRYKVRVYIVSHKTKFAQFDETRTDLREAALTWMRKSRLFESEGLGLSQGDICFESTRREKIERIRHLKCTHFIDDLEEIFVDPSFPPGVDRLLYAPYEQCSALPSVKVFPTWREIGGYFFNGASG